MCTRMSSNAFINDTETCSSHVCLIIGSHHPSSIYSKGLYCHLYCLFIFKDFFQFFENGLV